MPADPSTSAAARRARAALDPVDIALRRARTYQRIRRTVLAMSVLTVLGMPFVAAQGWAWPKETWVGATGTVRIFGLEFLDPLLAAGVALAHGPRLGLLLTALPVLVLVALLGRFFCGWLCPYRPLLAVSDSLRWCLRRAGLSLPDLALPGWLRFVALAAVLGVTALLGEQVATLVYPPVLIARSVYRLASGMALGASGIVLSAFLLLDTAVSRAGVCRALCPGGALFSLLGAYSPLRIGRRATACTDCTVCDRVCSLGQRPMRDMLDAGCERCGRCIAACPTGALSLTFRLSTPRGEEALRSEQPPPVDRARPGSTVGERRP